MNNAVIDAGKPWYRQFWAWFILTPLLVVIVVCSITVTIAFTNQDDIVVDNYYKEGRMINMRIEQDEMAQAMNLKGSLAFDQVVGEVWLELDSNEALPQELILNLDHPASRLEDRQLVLKQVSAGRYRADLSEHMDNRWYVRILPHQEMQIAEAPWRLKGEVDFHTGNTVWFGMNE